MLQQIHGIAHGIENRRSSISGPQLLQVFRDVVCVPGKALEVNRLGIENHQRSFSSSACREEIEQRAKLGQFVEFETAGTPALNANHQ